MNFPLDEFGHELDRRGNLVAVEVRRGGAALAGTVLAAMVMGAERHLVHGSDHGGAAG